MITIFTPTYNNAKRLPVLYKSLINQSCEDFEWVIVDDGSTDNTEKYINSIKKDALFSISYKKIKHGGKHRAINEGAKYAKGEYFFIVDSDDYLASTAVEDIIKFFNSLDKNKKYAGISTIKLSTGEIYKNKDKQFDYKYSDRFLLLIENRHAEIYFTEIIKNHPFPEFEGEEFLIEDTLWDTLALEDYLLKFFYTVTYLNEEHNLKQEEILTKYSDNPEGLFEWARVELRALKGFSYRIYIFRKVWYSLRQKYSKKEICEKLNVSKRKFNSTLFFGKLLHKKGI